MFHQVENTSSPILDWDFCIRYKRVVANTVGWYTYNYMPDGHISTLKVRLFNLLSMLSSIIKIMFTASRHWGMVHILSKSRKLPNSGF